MDEGRHTPSADDEALDALATMASDITGIQLGPEKRELVRGRLQRRLRALHLPDLTAYATHVRRDRSGRELSEMLDVLTTNKTSFYRESRHFEVLSSFLPDCLEGGRPPRLWSAGCSSGEEPYTMAMLVREVTGRLWPTPCILATDVSSKMLDAARKAEYQKDSLETLPAGWVQRHTIPGPGPKSSDRPPLLRIAPPLAALVSFARLNLLGDWPMTGVFDSIFCRNVMIYFDRKTRQELACRYAERLAPGGLLFIGMAESLSGLDQPLGYIEPGVYRK